MTQAQHTALEVLDEAVYTHSAVSQGKDKEHVLHAGLRQCTLQPLELSPSTTQHQGDPGFEALSHVRTACR